MYNDVQFSTTVVGGSGSIGVVLCSPLVPEKG